MSRRGSQRHPVATRGKQACRAPSYAYCLGMSSRMRDAPTFVQYTPLRCNPRSATWALLIAGHSVAIADRQSIPSEEGISRLIAEPAIPTTSSSAPAFLELWNSAAYPGWATDTREL